MFTFLQFGLFILFISTLSIIMVVQFELEQRNRPKFKNPPALKVYGKFPFKHMPIPLVEYIFRFLLGAGQINSSRCLLQAYSQYKPLFLIVTDEPGSSLSSSRTLFCVPGIRTIGLMEYESLLATPKNGFPDGSETTQSIVILSYQWFMILETQGLFSRFGGCAHHRAIQPGSIVLLCNMFPQKELRKFGADILSNIRRNKYIDYRAIIQQWSKEKGAAFVYPFFSFISVLYHEKLTECIDVDELRLIAEDGDYIWKFYKTRFPLVVKYLFAGKAYSLGESDIDTGGPSHSKDLQFFNPSELTPPNNDWDTLNTSSMKFLSLKRTFISDEVFVSDVYDHDRYYLRWDKLPQFPQLEELTLFISTCYSNISILSTKETIRLNTPRLKVLKVNFNGVKFPIIHDVEYPSRLSGPVTLIMDYIPWRYHAIENTAPLRPVLPRLHPEPLRITFKHLVLNGLYSFILEYCKWERVESLYWKRLEDCRWENYPLDFRRVELRCPQLREIKIFTSTKVRWRIPRIVHAPKLEKLVLVELNKSVTGPCYLSTFMDTEVYTPSQLRHLTFSRHHTCVTLPPSSVTAGHLNIVKRFITHLYIHRHVPVFLDDANLRLIKLEYLELDVTLIEPDPDAVTRLVIRDTMFPKLKTLVVTVPQLLNDSYRDTGPLWMFVPDTCHSVCISSVLMRAERVVAINGIVLVPPTSYMAHTKSEIHLNYSRPHKYLFFIYRGLVMAPCGRSMEDCIESQWFDFDQERKPR